MLNHVMVGATDIERSKQFYDAVLGVLGVDDPAPNRAASGHMRYFYRHDGHSFVISEPINGEPASAGNGSTVAFRCSSPEQVVRFHDQAVANGGTSIEAPPGPRPAGAGTVYLGYVRDPDGNKLCAIHRPA